MLIGVGRCCGKEGALVSVGILGPDIAGALVAVGGSPIVIQTASRFGDLLMNIQCVSCAEWHEPHRGEVLALICV